MTTFRVLLADADVAVRGKKGGVRLDSAAGTGTCCPWAPPPNTSAATAAAFPPPPPFSPPPHHDGARRGHPHWRRRAHLSGGGHLLGPRAGAVHILSTTLPHPWGLVVVVNGVCATNHLTTAASVAVVRAAVAVTRLVTAAGVRGGRVGWGALTGPRISPPGGGCRSRARAPLRRGGHCPGRHRPTLRWVSVGGSGW